MDTKLAFTNRHHAVHSNYLKYLFFSFLLLTLLVSNVNNTYYTSSLHERIPSSAEFQSRQDEGLEHKPTKMKKNII